VSNASERKPCRALGRKRQSVSFIFLGPTGVGQKRTENWRGAGGTEDFLLDFDLYFLFEVCYDASSYLVTLSFELLF